MRGKIGGLSNWGIGGYVIVAFVGGFEWIGVFDHFGFRHQVFGAWHDGLF